MMRLALPLVLATMALQEKRAPVPDAAAQKEAEKLIRDVLKDDYARSSPADRVALARKLLQQGVETKEDQAAQYVLFREAWSIAAGAGDTATALGAIDEMARRFEVNVLAMKYATLSEAAILGARTPQEMSAGAEALLRLADEALAQQDVDAAEKSAKAASAAAKNAKNAPLAARADAKAKEAADSRAKAAKVKKAAETLTKNPGTRLPPSSLDG